MRIHLPVPLPVPTPPPPSPPPPSPFPLFPKENRPSPPPWTRPQTPPPGTPVGTRTPLRKLTPVKTTLSQRARILKKINLAWTLESFKFLLEIFNLAWKLQSRLKISILTLGIPHKNRGLVGGSLEIFQSRLKMSFVSISLENFNLVPKSWFFQDLGPLGLVSARRRRRLTKLIRAFSALGVCEFLQAVPGSNTEELPHLGNNHRSAVGGAVAQSRLTQPSFEHAAFGMQVPSLAHHALNLPEQVMKARESYERSPIKMVEWSSSTGGSHTTFPKWESHLQHVWQPQSGELLYDRFPFEFPLKRTSNKLS